MYRSTHTKARLRRLKMLPLFASCSTNQLRRLEPLMSETRASEGSVLTSCNERGAEFFVVLKGTASVWREGVRLDVVGPGGFFGEVSLFDHGIRTASVIADTDMELFVLSPQEFRSPHFLIQPVMERMLEVSSQRLRRATEGWTSVGVPLRSSSDVPREPRLRVPSEP